MGFNKLEEVAHSGENLLALLRDGRLKLTPEITTALLSMVDAIRAMLTAVQTTGQDGDSDYPQLLETLQRLLSSAPGGSGPSAPVTLAEPSKLAEMPAEVAAPPPPSSENSQPRASAEAIIAPEPPVDTAPMQPLSSDGKHGTSPENPSTTARVDAPAASGGTATLETIRVGVNLLDKLMTLVGELVMARNQLLQFSNSLEDTSLQGVSQRMNLIAIAGSAESAYLRPKLDPTYALCLEAKTNAGPKLLPPRCTDTLPQGDLP